MLENDSIVLKFDLIVFDKKLIQSSIDRSFQEDLSDTDGRHATSGNFTLFLSIWHIISSKTSS